MAYIILIANSTVILMDTYHHVLSVIKKLGYICDTSPYLIDYQCRLSLRRSNKSLTYNHIERGADVESAPLFFILLLPKPYANGYREW